MDGIHDLGGMQGFGAVECEADEPVFHAAWEARMFAIAGAIPFSVPFSDDHFRREIERMAPAHYLNSSYYEKWFCSIVSLLRERGVISDGELNGADLSPLPADIDPAQCAAPQDIVPAIFAGASQQRADVSHTPHRFHAGDRVRTRDIMPVGHNRLPRYARAKIGMIEVELGSFIFADSHAASDNENPQQLYTVSFSARDLWGAEAENPNDTVTLDLWDGYLDPVTAP